MKEVALSGSIRENVGKKDAAAIRKEDRVPCVVYGGREQIHFSVRHTKIEQLITTPKVHIIRLDIDEKEVRTIIQDVQYHPVTDRIQHVDFIELREDKKVKIAIPVTLEGRSPGVIAGGKLQQVFRKLNVYALPSELPDDIKVDVSTLQIGDAIRVRDIALDQLEMLNPPSAVVCSVKMARGAQVNAEEEESEEGAA